MTIGFNLNFIIIISVKRESKNNLAKESKIRRKMIQIKKIKIMVGVIIKFKKGKILYYQELRMKIIIILNNNKIINLLTNLWLVKKIKIMIRSMICQQIISIKLILI